MLDVQFISSLVRNEKGKDGRKYMISFYAGQKRLIHQSENKYISSLTPMPPPIANYLNSKSTTQPSHQTENPCYGDCILSSVKRHGRKDYGKPEPVHLAQSDDPLSTP